MITASVVTYNTPLEDLSRIIDCVINSSENVKLYIIDNSPNDLLRDFINSKDGIKYIHSLNLGYGAGHNIAIKESIRLGAKYHVVLNPDIYWNDDILSTIKYFLNQTPDAGLVMPLVKYPNGEIQYLCKLLPTPFDLIIRRFIPLKSLQRKSDQKYELHNFEYDRILNIPSLSGCFMFMRCDVLKQIGGFDERFFMYAEDLDLCRRIGEVSKTIFYPEVTLVHVHEKGSYKNKKLLKYHICSMIKYFNKWGWFFDSKRSRINKECLKSINQKN